MKDGLTLAKVTDPAGLASYLCYECPGLTPDRDKATRFVSRHVATRAANAAIYGEPEAFWNSERESAERVRRERLGWTASVEAYDAEAGQ